MGEFAPERARPPRQNWKGRSKIRRYFRSISQNSCRPVADLRRPLIPALPPGGPGSIWANLSKFSDFPAGLMRYLLGRFIGEDRRSCDPPKCFPEISADLTLNRGGPFPPNPPSTTHESGRPDMGTLSNFGEFAPDTGAASMAKIARILRRFPLWLSWVW